MITEEFCTNCLRCGIMERKIIILKLYNYEALIVVLLTCDPSCNYWKISHAMSSPKLLHLSILLPVYSRSHDIRMTWRKGNQAEHYQEQTINEFEENKASSELATLEAQMLEQDLSIPRTAIASRLLTPGLLCCLLISPSSHGRYCSPISLSPSGKGHRDFRALAISARDSPWVVLGLCHAQVGAICGARTASPAAFLLLFELTGHSTRFLAKSKLLRTRTRSSAVVTPRLRTPGWRCPRSSVGATQATRGHGDARCAGLPRRSGPRAGTEHVPIPQTTRQESHLTKNITEPSCESKAIILHASLQPR